MWQPGKAAQTGASSRESQQEVASLQRHEGKHIRLHLPASAGLPADVRCLTVSKSHQQSIKQVYLSFHIFSSFSVSQLERTDGEFEPEKKVIPDLVIAV